MAIRDKEFNRQFDEILLWIKESVSTFKNDTAKTKLNRIEKARHDKEFFAKTYLPHYCESDFDDIHRDMFDLCDQWNTPTVIAGYRESAKSTVVGIIDELHKTVFKLNHFTMLISDSEDNAINEYMLLIKAELELNPRIIADFGDQKSSNWKDDNFITKSGKRFTAIGLRQGAKGKKHKQHRPDRVIIEDIENINSSKKKSVIRKRIKWIVRDVWRGLNSTRRQMLFLGNYFSKKTIIHILLTSDEYKHWNRRIYTALITDKKSGNLRSSWESRHPTKRLLKDREAEPSNFRVEMMQKPDDEEGVFTEEMIHYYKPEDIEGLKLTPVTYVDPSAKKGEEHCFKAIIVLLVCKETGRMYVARCWMKKTSKRKMVISHYNLSSQYGSVHDGIEGNGFQSTLKEDYDDYSREAGRIMNLKLITNSIPKETRISRRQTPVETGRILFLENAEQNELIDQLLDYPDGEFDDAIDALDGAVSIAETHVFRSKNTVSVDELYI